MLSSLQKATDLAEKAQKLGIPLSQILLVAMIAGVIWYQPEWMIEHRKLCLIFIACYEALILVFVPIRWMGRLAQRVWSEEFEEPAVRMIAQKVRGMASRNMPGAGASYDRLVTLEQEVYNTRGLGLFDSHTLKLDQVFVELKISDLENTLDINLDPIARRRFASARKIWDFIAALELNKPRTRNFISRRFSRRFRQSKPKELSVLALAVVGPPGCGKSTLLQYIAFILATGQQRRYKIPAYTPILLFLREHVSTICSNQNISLSTLTHSYYVKKYGGMEDAKELIPPETWVSKRLTKGKTLVLLDGLDEVADEKDRKKISTWVETQMTIYPRCIFLVTSRPRGYVAAPLRRAQVVEVQPFNDDQVTQFVKNWYLANESIRAGKIIDEGVRYRAGKESNDLLVRLRKRKALKDLSVNPLLLNMITMVHKYRGALPGSRVELYGQICEVLLGRWKQAKEVEDKLSANQKLTILRPLAVTMMSHEKLTLPEPEVKKVIESVLRRISGGSLNVPEALDELQAGTALLQEREQGHWGFCHLTFQEYLTAAHWQAGKDVPQDWKPLVAQTWWHETLRLYAAQADATPILTACLDVGSLFALTLAADIMDERPHEISKEVRNAVIERTQASLEAEDLVERRFAAEIRLSQRLNSLYMIDDRTHIDLNPITCAEYQMFLDEMQQEDRFFHPDHWTMNSFSRGQSREPISGVRPEDAAAYCNWLTNKYGKQAKYRLPTLREAEVHVGGFARFSTWCQQDGQYALTPLADSPKEEIEKWVGAMNADLRLLSEEMVYQGDLCEALKNASNLLNDREMIVKEAQKQATSETLSLSVNMRGEELDLAAARDREREMRFEVGLVTDFKQLTEILAQHAKSFVERRPGVVDEAKAALSNFVFRLNERLPNLLFSGDRTDVLASAQALAWKVKSLNSVAHHSAAREYLPQGKVEGEINELTGKLVNFLEGSAQGAPLEYMRLFIKLIGVMRSQSSLESRRALRELILHVLGYAYKQHDSLSDKGVNKWVNPRMCKDLPNRDEEKSSIWNAYWWQQLILAREYSKLNTWESIRIVKEQSVENTLEPTVETVIAIDSDSIVHSAKDV